jgi:gliding motility-associated-like protein
LISPEITPDFTEAIYLGCHGDTVDFINTSSFPNSILPPIASYAWTFGDISPEDTSANPQHIYLTQGTYTVTLTVHNRGCSADTSEVISLVHPLHAGLVYTPASAILCQGSGATFTDTSSGGIVSSKLYFGTGATVSNTANVTYQYNNYGNYNAMLVVTDNVPCSDTVSVLVQVDSQSNVALNVTDSVICRSNDISFTGIYTTSGNTGITWNFGDGDSIQNINPAIHSYDATGTFTVTATAYFRACRDTSASKVITLFPQPSISIGPADTSICAGSSPLVLADNINSGNPGASWVWSTGQTGAEITVSSAGTYTATVSIHGCKSAATVNVTNDCYMSIPNVFTPNNDGLNDYFFPRTTLASGLISFSMSIYDRWGGLVYQSSSLDGRGWDGKLNNVAEPQGVYVYVIDATFKDGEAEHHQGNVTLIR